MVSAMSMSSVCVGRSAENDCIILPLQRCLCHIPLYSAFASKLGQAFAA